MKTGFKDPIEPKGNEKVLKSPFNFDAPRYDERSSNFVNAGSHYGVGFKQPVGHKGNPKVEAATLPKGHVKTLKVDEIPKRNLPLDIEL